MKEFKFYCLRGLGFLMVCMAVILAVPHAVAQESVQIRVDGPRGGDISVGDRFTLTYIISNIEEPPAKPANVPGAQVSYWTLSSQSSSFSSINGRTTSSVKLTYTATLKAQKEGTYSFGPVTVGNVKSNTVKYTIYPEGHRSADQSVPSASNARGGNTAGSPQDAGAPADDKPKFIGKGNDNIFLRASVSKTTAWEQEALVYTVKLYTTYSPIKFIGATDAPKFDGFVVEESDQISHELTFETYNGRQYSTAVIARYIIFPQMEGKLTIKGNTYTVSTDEREYYDDPYFRTIAVRRPIQLNVTPNDLVVNVKGLPEPRPADFSGGVGQFSISSTLPKTSLRANEAASVVYTVTGTGNIKYVHLPDLNALYPAELEVYSPKTDVQAKAGASNVSGTARFDYSFMPMEEGTFEIPPVRLVYFNPATGKYETATARGYSVTVGKGIASTASQTRDRLKFNPVLMASGHLSQLHTPCVYRWSYWLVYILPVLILAIVAVIYRKQLKARADMEGMRSRRAAKVAARRLKKARVCVRTGDAHKFYEEMLTALWGYLGDKLKMPVSELSRANVSDVLLAKGISQRDIDDLLGVIDDCELARYAPASTGKTLQETYSQGADVIGRLEGDFKNKPVSSEMNGPDAGLK